MISATPAFTFYFHCLAFVKLCVYYNCHWTAEERRKKKKRTIITVREKKKKHYLQKQHQNQQMQISCTLTGVFFFFYKSKIIGGRLPSRLEEAKGETLRCSPRAEVGRICRSEKKAHTSQVESCTSLSTAATHHARCGWSQWRLKNNNLRVSFLFSSSLTCLKAEFVAAVLLFRSSLSASLSSSSPRCQLLFFFPSLLLRVPSAVETSFFTSHFSPT